MAQSPIGPANEVLGAHVNAAEAEAMRTLAREGDRSVSAECRRAIRAYIAANENPAQRTTGRGSKVRAGGRNHEAA